MRRRARARTVFAPADVTASPLPAGTGTAARSHLVYRVSSGRIRWVAAVTAFDARRASRIRSDVRAAGLR